MALENNDSLSQYEFESFQILINKIAADTSFLSRYNNLGNQYKHIVAGINKNLTSYSIREEYYGNDLSKPIVIIENESSEITWDWRTKLSKWEYPLISPLYPRSYIKYVGDYLSIFKKVRLKIKSLFFPLFRRPVKENYVIIDFLYDAERSNLMVTFKVPVEAKRKLTIIWGIGGSWKKELEFWLN